MEARIHDIKLYRTSNTEQDFLNGMEVKNCQFSIFGDPANALGMLLITPIAGANLSQDKRQFNMSKSRKRTTVEW